MPYTPIPHLTIAGVDIPTHGLMFLCAALVCLALLRAQLSTQEFRGLLNSIPWLTMGSLVGARAAYILSRPDVWTEPLAWGRFWEGGMVSYGGLAGSLAVLWLRHGKEDGLAFFDRLAGPCLVAWGVGRIGCFLSWYGEAGEATTVPWGVVVAGSPRHAVTAYLATLYIVGGIVLLSLPGSKTGRKSSIALIYFGLARGLTDQWRDYEPDYLRSLSQAVSSIITALGLILFRRTGRVPTRYVESDR